jgi:hypothetical protein
MRASNSRSERLHHLVLVGRSDLEQENLTLWHGPTSLVANERPAEFSRAHRAEGMGFIDEHSGIRPAEQGYARIWVHRSLECLMNSSVWRTACGARETK